MLIAMISRCTSRADLQCRSGIVKRAGSIRPSLGGTLPFKQVSTASLMTVRAGEKTEYIDVQCATHRAQGTVLRCRREGSWIDGTPLFGSLFQGDTFAWTKMQLDYQYGAKETTPTAYSALDAPDTRPSVIKPPSRWTFTLSSWQGEAAGFPKQERVSCKTGDRYAASQILPDLTGMAIDLHCWVTGRGAKLTATRCRTLKVFASISFARRCIQKLPIRPHTPPLR